MASLSSLIVFLPLLGSLVAGQQGTFSFANIYGDSMVLQRAPRQAVVWGYAERAGAEVTVEIAGQRKQTTSIQGPGTGVFSWRVVLDAVSTPGPFLLKATSSGKSITLKDILFGDVWVCSGQSNMCHTVGRLDEPQKELADVPNFPNVRVMTVGRFASPGPRNDLRARAVWGPTTAARVNQFSAVCWLMGKELNRELKYPIGLINSCWGGTRIEAWSSNDALAKCPPRDNAQNPVEGTLGIEPHRTPTTLYNGMIYPLLPMTMTGAAWYQGESNAGQANRYVCQQAAMIDDWRSKWSQKTSGLTDPVFPFGVVQLAPNKKTAVPITRGMPDLRWAQTAEYGYTPNPVLKRTFLAVAVDLPDPNGPHGSIHPRYKRDIGKRLFYGAMNVGYGRTNVKFQGPFPTSAVLEGGVILKVTFDNGAADLAFRVTDGFEICCSTRADDTQCTNGGSWQYVRIVSNDRSSASLDVTSCSGKHVTVLRYLWAETPCELRRCAVYSKDNSLPAPPFVYNKKIEVVNKV